MTCLYRIICLFQITYFVLSGSFNSAITFLEAYVNFTKDSAVRQLKDVLKGLDIDLLNDENTTQDYISYQKVTCARR